jgi:hypothetical protein
MTIQEILDSGFVPIRTDELVMPGAIVTHAGIHNMTAEGLIKIWERGLEDSRRQLDKFREKVARRQK